MHACILSDSSLNKYLYCACFMPDIVISGLDKTTTMTTKTILCSFYVVPGSILRTLQIPTHLAFWGRYYYYNFHFTEKYNEAQIDQET